MGEGEYHHVLVWVELSVVYVGVAGASYVGDAVAGHVGDEDGVARVVLGNYIFHAEELGVDVEDSGVFHGDFISVMCWVVGARIGEGLRYEAEGVGTGGVAFFDGFVECQSGVNVDLLQGAGGRFCDKGAGGEELNGVFSGGHEAPYDVFRARCSRRQSNWLRM